MPQAGTSNYEWIVPRNGFFINLLASGGGGGGGVSVEGKGGGGAGASTYNIGVIHFRPCNKYTVKQGLGGSQGVDGGDTSLIDSTNSVLLKVVGGMAANGRVGGRGGFEADCVIRPDTFIVDPVLINGGTGGTSTGNNAGGGGGGGSGEGGKSNNGEDGGEGGQKSPGNARIQSGGNGGDYGRPGQSGNPDYRENGIGGGGGGGGGAQRPKFPNPVSGLGGTGFINFQIQNVTTAIFDQPGTYTWQRKFGLQDTVIRVWAAGGSGGATGVNSANKGGGGGGAYSEKFMDTDANVIYEISVGAGGTVDGTRDGGDSYFRQPGLDLIIAKGGKGGGGPDDNRQGGLGGVASSGLGDIKYSGGDGASTAYPTTGGAGGGASGNPCTGDGVDGRGPVGQNGGFGGASDQDGGAGGNGGSRDLIGYVGNPKGGGGGGGGYYQPSGNGGHGKVEIFNFTY